MWWQVRLRYFELVGKRCVDLLGAKAGIELKLMNDGNEAVRPQVCWRGRPHCGRATGIFSASLAAVLGRGLVHSMFTLVPPPGGG